ncbi:MAG UNVERIFIED_CONTAM: hypothetical protein LVR18_48355 [Planctomycetaceae bacterium]
MKAFCRICIPLPSLLSGVWRSRAVWCRARTGSWTASSAKKPCVSSQIEGTQATLEDVVAWEATRRSDRPSDVEEICNYVDASTLARA